MPTYKILYDAIHSAMVIRIVVKRILFETLIFFSGIYASKVRFPVG